MNAFKVLALAGLAVSLSACDEIIGSGSTGINSQSFSCNINAPDPVNCLYVKSFSSVIVDDFERDVAIPSNSSTVFGWRKIIDDWGRIVDSSAGNNVNAEIYGDDFFVPGSNDGSALLFRGRHGHSVHNIYFITKTFNVSQVTNGNAFIINFDYLLMDLEEGEYLRVEVCNNTAENCGVGTELTLAGLNGPHWQSVLELDHTQSISGANGTNHSLSDWRRIRVPLFLENFQQQEFIFRFNVRVDEGFIGNNPANGLEDGVAIDNVTATAYEVDTIIIDNPTSSPEDILY